MSAPYAFRAQTAEYANQAGGNFTAAGNITAANITTAGNLLNTVGTTVNVGGPANSVSANIANINAKEVDIRAGTDDLMMSSSDKIIMNAAGTIGVLGSSTLSVYLSSTIDISSLDGTSYLRGKNGVRIESSTGNISLNPATSVVGYDTLYWSLPGSAVTASPILMKSVSITLAASSYSATYSTGVSIDQYSCAIIGIKNLNGGNKPRNFYVIKSGGYWHVVVYFDRDSVTASDDFTVDVMCVNKNLVNDLR
jgi:hypothetical protein